MHAGVGGQAVAHGAGDKGVGGQGETRQAGQQAEEIGEGRGIGVGPDEGIIAPDTGVEDGVVELDKANIPGGSVVLAR